MNTNTHTITASINYSILRSQGPSHCPGILPQPWTAPSDIPHSSFSKASTLSSPSSSIFLSLAADDGLTCHRYFIVKRTALRQEREVSSSHHPSLNNLSVCFIFLFQFCLPLHTVSVCLDSLLLKTPIPFTFPLPVNNRP